MRDFVLVRRVREWPESYAIMAVILFAAAAIGFTSGSVVRIIIACVLAFFGIQALIAVFSPRFRYRPPDA